MPDYQTNVPKPYDFVQFPNTPPTKKKPIGHHKYIKNHIHGTLHLELTVGTGVHVSTGRVVMGEDVGQNRTPLIKTMLDGGKSVPIIPGSSLKGVVRSVYEAITNSTLAVVTKSYRDQMPQDRLPCGDKEELCPASKVFGALDWQGLISFQDAICTDFRFSQGFMPPLFRPRPDQTQKYFEPVSRKFYHHAVKAVDKGSKGIPVQKVGEQKVFQTKVQLKNLTFAEFGTLLIALGQDSKHSFALKVGAGKPIGMGTMEVNLVKFEQATSLKKRYSNYGKDSVQVLTEDRLGAFVKEAIKQSHQEELVQLAQLQELSEILKYPTDRQAPTDMY